MAVERAQWLPAGRIGRPHGLDGSFRVTRPRPELLARGMTLLVGEREAVIERRSGTDERPILRISGIATPEEVKASRGEDLFCRRSDAPELPEGRWWPEDLAGLAVRDGSERVGKVRRMVALPSCEVLEVERDGAPDLMVPMVADAVRSIDVEAGEVDVDLRFMGEDGNDGD
ncbi:MAG: ribosome maturation factor RimM [Solirubrobacterales bacterium]